MESFFEELPTTVKEHIRDITRTSGLPDGDESLDLMAEAWLGKKEAFEREIELQNMEEVDELNKDDERGALVMTYSGSLVNIGPIDDGKRVSEYTSIGIRSDVPDSAEHDQSELAYNVNVDCEVEFKEGPVTSTSSVYKIAVCKDDLSVEDQEQALSNATMILSKEFADINKTIII